MGATVNADEVLRGSGVAGVEQGSCWTMGFRRRRLTEGDEKLEET